MITLLRRSYDILDGVDGTLITPLITVYTLELPWKDNVSGISCIPLGTYKMTKRISPRFGSVFHIHDVENRSWILTHWGNWAGDVLKGRRSDSEGCILVGMKIGIAYGQKAVLMSRVGFYSLMKYLSENEYDLIIKNI